MKTILPIFIVTVLISSCGCIFDPPRQEENARCVPSEEGFAKMKNALSSEQMGYRWFAYRFLTEKKGAPSPSTDFDRIRRDEWRVYVDTIMAWLNVNNFDDESLMREYGEWVQYQSPYCFRFGFPGESDHDPLKEEQGAKNQRDNRPEQ